MHKRSSSLAAAVRRACDTIWTQSKKKNAPLGTEHSGRQVVSHDERVRVIRLDRVLVARQLGSCELSRTYSPRAMQRNL